MFIIRKSQPSDLSALAKIYLEGRTETFHWVGGEAFRLGDFAKDTEGEEVLVAAELAGPIGFVSVWKPDHFVHHLYVRREFWNRGVGEHLLRAALNNLSRPARLKCVERNSRACEFYEKRGWKLESLGSDELTGTYRTYRLDE